MRNCIILGSGRSGTSMVAGCLAAAGYYMGDELYPPRGSNPKGFFEGPQINGINETLLAQVVPAEQGLRYGQRWLADLPPGNHFSMSSGIKHAIHQMLQHEPYCFKDPRFSYTLPAWVPYVLNTSFVCVFRDPGITAESIVKECAEESYLSNVQMTISRALNIWTSVYTSIINLEGLQNSVIYMHYSQIVNGAGLENLSRILDTPVDRTFPDASLCRSRSTNTVPPDTISLYENLCQLSGYSGNHGPDNAQV